MGECQSEASEFAPVMGQRCKTISAKYGASVARRKVEVTGLKKDFWEGGRKLVRRGEFRGVIQRINHNWGRLRKGKEKYQEGLKNEAINVTRKRKTKSKPPTCGNIKRRAVAFRDFVVLYLIVTLKEM